jgi:transposase-like protein
VVLRRPHFPSSALTTVHHFTKMTRYTPAFKHAVLREYCAGNRSHSFRALARRFKVHGGKSTISAWYRLWNGTPHSLERRHGSGRKASLTREQVGRLIVKPIRRCNRNHVAVEYHDLQEAVEEKVTHPVSLRTIQRYGKEAGGIQFHSTIPRTPQERTI